MAADTTCSIIKGLQEHESAGVTELADHLEMSKSVVYNYLTTLQENGFVVKENTTYRLSLQFLNIGEEIRNNKSLYQAAKPKVDDLATESGEFAHLIVPERGWGYCLYRAKGENAVATTSRIGKQDYLHRTGAGKAILAHLDPECVEEIIQTQGLPPKTDNSITDHKQLYQELENIRENDVAIADEECINGARAVGAPIIGMTGKVLGAISISGPTARLKGNHLHEDLAELVVKTANYIEITINTREETE